MADTGLISMTSQTHDLGAVLLPVLVYRGQGTLSKERKGQ